MLHKYALMREKEYGCPEHWKEKSDSENGDNTHTLKEGDICSYHTTVSMKSGTEWHHIRRWYFLVSN
jgi:hypothetical protein